jgi:Bacterial regulatory proteins, tetR family
MYHTVRDTPTTGEHMTISSTVTNTVPGRTRVRTTPSLREVQAMYGDTPVEAYDPHFLMHPGQQKRSLGKIKLIADTAESLLADPVVGVNWITCAFVAERAGVSIGSIYRYFEDIIAILDYVWPERVNTFSRV